MVKPAQALYAIVEIMDSVTMLITELSNPWVLFGFLGQFVFFMRFVFQWLASEKNQKIVIPAIFWWLSIGGSIMILIYSIHIKDIVFSTAQVGSLFIYARNLSIERKSVKAT